MTIVGRQYLSSGHRWQVAAAPQRGEAFSREASVAVCTAACECLNSDWFASSIYPICDTRECILIWRFEEKRKSQDVPAFVILIYRESLNFFYFALMNTHEQQLHAGKRLVAPIIRIRPYSGSILILCLSLDSARRMLCENSCLPLQEIADNNIRNKFAQFNW